MADEMSFPPEPDEAAALLDRIERNHRWEDRGHDTKCKTYTGYCTPGDGYATGTWKHGTTTWRLARMVWLLEHHIPIPRHVHVRFKCANHACLNVEHMRLGSVADAHEVFASERRKGKLTQAQIREMMVRHAAGEAIRALGRVYGVTPSAVRRYVLGRTWHSRTLSSAPECKP